MNPVSHSALRPGRVSGASYAMPRQGPGEDAGEGEDGLELPVNPDQGMPLVPDEEGGIATPS
ncbi:MAG: hypothetical protein JWR74_3171 [Polaromonas sp.]|nr:hypothetical protein [Polaromonas sp.]